MGAAAVCVLRAWCPCLQWNSLSNKEPQKHWNRPRARMLKTENHMSKSVVGSLLKTKQNTEGKFVGRKEKAKWWTKNNGNSRMKGNKIKMAAMAGKWVSQGGTRKRKCVVWAQWLSLETIHKRKRRSSVANTDHNRGRTKFDLLDQPPPPSPPTPQVSLRKPGEGDFRHWIYSDDFRTPNCFCRL